MGLGLRVLLSPVFLKIEYNMPYFPPDTYGFTKEDRLKWAPYTLDVVVATLGSPLAGLGVAVKKIAEKAREEVGIQGNK